MKTPRKLDEALSDLRKEAGQEAIDAFGRELMALLARHGFQATAPEEPVHRLRRVPPPKKKPPTLRKPTATAASTADPPTGTDLGRVLMAVRANPGLRGFELARPIADNGGAIKVKTLRTSLARLRDRKLIYQTDSKWYAFGQKRETAA